MKLIFRWYDFYVGIFVDTKQKYLYVFLIPCIGVRITYNKNKFLLPANYWFNTDMESDTHKYCLFYKKEQVGAFKTRFEATHYAITHNYNNL